MTMYICDTISLPNAMLYEVKLHDIFLVSTPTRVGLIIPGRRSPKPPSPDISKSGDC